MGPRRWHKLVPTATLTAVTFTVTTQSAQALFPPIWPRTPPVSVVVPPVQPPVVIVVPPVDPPPVDPPIVPPVIPPIVPPVNPPTAVPEPSTMVMGAAGLAAAAGWRARRRKGS